MGGRSIGFSKPFEGLVNSDDTIITSTTAAELNLGLLCVGMAMCLDCRLPSLLKSQVSSPKQ